MAEREMAGLEGIMIDERGLENLSNAIRGPRLDDPKNAARVATARALLDKLKKKKKK